MLEFIRDPEILRNLVSTGILVVLIFATRFMLTRMIGRTNLRQKPDLARAWFVQLNNISTLLLIIGLVLIWAAKLQAFAISLMAVGVALVIATKELILCFTGGLYKSFNQLFRVGDRIEISGFRGVVIGHNFLATELLEIGPGHSTHHFTGRSIEVPNSLFLTASLLKEEISDKYRLHTFSVIEPRAINVIKHRDQLLASATKFTSEFIGPSKAFMDEVQRKKAIEAPTIEPRVSISLLTIDQVEFIVRVPAPGNILGRIEQKIIEDYVKSTVDFQK